MKNDSFFRKHDLSQSFQPEYRKKGLRLFYDGECRNYLAEYSQDGKTVDITCDFPDDHIYGTRITVLLDDPTRFGASCSCPASQKDHECEHLAALAYALTQYKVRKYIPETTADPDSSDEFLDLLDDINGENETGDKKGTVELLPVIYYEDDSSLLHIRFRIGEGKNTYLIPNLDQFLDDLSDHNMHRYGKKLAFKHYVSAFTDTAKEFIALIKDMHFDLKVSGNTYSYYYFRPSLFDKMINLKPVFLDRFMQIAEKTGLTAEIPSESYSYTVKFSHEPPAFKSTLTKEGNGFRLTMNAPYCMFSGTTYYYAFAMDDTLHIWPKQDSNYSHILSFINYSHGSAHYINKRDLPAFSRTLYPFLKDNTELNAPDFDVTDYIPETPTFSLFLDIHEDNAVHAKLEAEYKSHKYNLFQGPSPLNKRDSVAEQNMCNMLTKWCTENDEETSTFVMPIESDDQLYDFLSIGVTEMQHHATVYLGDGLKRFAIMKQPVVTVGVSATKSVLQLNLQADTLSNEQFSEILSRYTRKKKYIRLKNGAFIRVDDPDSIEHLQHIQDVLQLKTKEITKGSVRLPRYRAMYLDGLAEDENFTIRKDKKFVSFINKLKDIDVDKSPIPQTMKQILRPYQIDGVRWLNALQECGLGALLADEMGLGKTLQVLSFIQSHPEFENILVVCPASLVYNWYAEVKKFTPDISCMMITGNAEERTALLHQTKETKIIITSYDLLRRDLEQYQSMHFDVQIIDEAQYIKNATTQASQGVKTIDSEFRIALTGTPIENRLSELWSIFDYILPGFFGTYTHFRKLYELPISKHKEQQAEKELQSLIRPFILRRRKKDVLKDLPEKLEEVYYAYPDKEQQQLYEARVQRLKQNLARTSEKDFNTAKIEILAELTRLREICCDPSLLYENYKGESAKTELCIRLLSQAVESGHQVLLFSQFTTMFDILTKRMEEEGITYNLLTGSTPVKERAKLVESFQKGEVQVFCISLKAGGTGLNLTAADIVIHYDPWWNTAVENQASDRAHRIGQTNVVTVYRLILKDTIEERIVQMQDDKQDLAERMLSGEGISGAAFSKEDLMNMLK